jgi:hypothetical protein
MNLESIIENNEQKIIFLKAIILGINYGKSDNADIYRHNILNEIKKLNGVLHKLQQPSASQIALHDGQNLNESSEKININKKSLNNLLNRKLNDDTLFTQKNEEVINVKQPSLSKSTEKYDTNILNLEKQKLYTINLINNLSVSNYQYNYSKINLLKSNLINIDKEIEKNKINISHRNTFKTPT